MWISGGRESNFEVTGDLGGCGAEGVVILMALGKGAGLIYK